jgi:hypothetical protein
MKTFLSIHQDEILGTLSCFDRIIIRGHLTGLFPKGAFGYFLSSQDVLLKDFGPYVEEATGQLKVHAKQIAADAGRPYQYLESATTKAQGTSKEDLARAMAAREGIPEGLIVVFAVLEPCQSFEVRKNHETGKLEAVRCWRKCLHFYFYFMDRDFGLMHVRLQSWFPFDMQVYVNGHEWLARQLDKKGIAYERYDNCFTRVDDLKLAQQLCDKFVRRKWLRVLDAFARHVNPLLKTIQQAGFKGYYWSLTQCEYSMDVLFRDRATLEQWLPALYELTLTAFSAEDVMRFLGRKLHGNFQGEVRTDLKRRREGRRAKHWVKRNSIKMYDKASVLRIETTLNNPREFKVLRVIETPRGRQRQWRPMNKGVANFWRYAQVSAQANVRYLEALAQAQPKGKAIAELDRLCQPRRVDGKRYARFQPFSAEDCQMFAAVLDGKHALNGFRNKDLQARLYATPAVTPEDVRRRSQRVSRKIAKLRGHGLVKKVKGARLYRPTECGTRLMAAALHCRNKEFPGCVLRPK